MSAVANFLWERDVSAQKEGKFAGEEAKGDGWNYADPVRVDEGFYPPNLFVSHHHSCCARTRQWLALT